MRGGFGALRSKGSLHRDLTASETSKVEVQPQLAEKAPFSSAASRKRGIARGYAIRFFQNLGG